MTDKEKTIVNTGNEARNEYLYYTMRMEKGLEELKSIERLIWLFDCLIPVLESELDENCDVYTEQKMYLDKGKELAKELVTRRANILWLIQDAMEERRENMQEYIKACIANNNYPTIFKMISRGINEFSFPLSELLSKEEGFEGSDVDYKKTQSIMKDCLFFLSQYGCVI